ncbi:MAG: hypothetical protein HYW27_00085 [Candidatus Aenigmarchaeota archaeon]|nr:hypothetical protein [Candidatus Aenigmarchaeota archaeon]
MRKIILDTNFLLAPLQAKADVYSMEGDLYTLESCVNELKRLSGEKTRRGSQAKAALEIVRGRVKVIKNPMNADRMMAEYAAKGYIIATNDKKLITKLKKLGHSVIRLKQNKIITED